MFKRARHTLRADHRGLRSTLKQQRGGASLQTLCGWRKTDPTKTKWSIVLVKPEFKFLLDGGWITQPTATEQYKTIVECQDELFMLAMDAMYAELGITDKTNETEILRQYAAYDKSKLSSLTDYIKDVFYVITLKELKTLAASGRGSPSKTKFEEITAEPLLHLLLNPLRVQNHFIFNVASFIKNLKENPIAGFDDTKAGLMAIRYDSLAKANTLNMTSTDLRDGPTLSMTTTSVNSLLGTNKLSINDSFWYKFLAYANNKKPDFTSDINIETYTQGVNSWSSMPDSYAILSAYIYSLYKNNKDMRTAFTLFANKDATEIDELKFLHHLIYTIESLTPSAVPTSSQGTVVSKV
jgi:hypothetical protein